MNTVVTMIVALVGAGLAWRVVARWRQGCEDAEMCARLRAPGAYDPDWLIRRPDGMEK